MPDEFSGKTEKFLRRWAPLTEVEPIQAQDDTPEQIQQRPELFMKKVESQAEQGLADRRASPIGWFYWQLVFARLQHPVAVTALIISICAALFLGVTKYSRRELHQSVVVS